MEQADAACTCSPPALTLTWLSLSLGLCFLAFSPATNSLLPYFRLLIPERESMKDNLIDKISSSYYHQPCWHRLIALGQLTGHWPASEVVVLRSGSQPCPVSEWNRDESHRACPFFPAREQPRDCEQDGCSGQADTLSPPGHCRSMPLRDSANTHALHPEAKMRLTVLRTANLKLWLFIRMFTLELTVSLV